MTNNNILTIIYFLLVIVCIAISLILSYYGYLTNFGNLALPFTIAIGLGLFGADILIRSRRVAGRNLTAPMLLFAFFAIFSAVSNFNFLYTNFMKSDVTNAAIASATSQFRQDITQTRSRLQELDVVNFVASQRLELERELSRLRDQINDPLRPGCGERCALHLSNIEGILGKQLTDTARPGVGTSLQIVNAWYDRIRNSAIQDFSQQVSANQFPQVERLIDDINQLLADFDGTTTEANWSGHGLQILETLSRSSIDVERRANAFMPESRQVSHRYIDVTLGRLGEIVYSLENAFVVRPNIGATIAASILAVVVDVFPVLFALVAFTPDPSGRPAHQGPTRKRGGRVL